MITAEEKLCLEEYLEKNRRKNETILDNIRNFVEDEAVQRSLVDFGAFLLGRILGNAEEPVAGNRPVSRSRSSEDGKKSEMENWMQSQQEDHVSFSELLLDHLKDKGYQDHYSDFYKKIDMDRRLFSKLSSARNKYRPEKKTIFKILIGLELELNKALELLEAGGYTFHNYEQYDLIIKYCIEKGVFDTAKVDEYLVLFGEKPLFSL